jgi:regulation of enolase protein 1 (concanavalin A-like superfamily)
MRSTSLVVAGALLVFLGAAAAEDRAVKGWGKVADPTGECKVQVDDGKLTVRVPAGTYDLNPKLGGMKAPRVLQEVSGDFTVQVKVTADFDPGDKAAQEGTSSFHGAGLIVWQDEKNYLRVERNAWWVAQVMRTACFPPLMEYFKDGEYQETNPQATIEDFFQGRSTWFRVARQKDTVTVSVSHDGKEWMVAKEIPVAFGPKVQVGVAVINTAAKAFPVEFSDLKVTGK